METINRPKVGIGVILIKEDKILMGLRKNSHGTGTWGFPGGHLELNESIEECSIREVLEESGLTIKNIRHLAFTNDIFTDENKHYVTLFILADYNSGELKNLEPQKLEKWEWFKPSQLPSPLFFPILNLLKQDIKLFKQE
ncbi:MAG: NUDIX hydrolase [Patescibacteria group bacterium]